MATLLVVTLTLSAVNTSRRRCRVQQETQGVGMTFQENLKRLMKEKGFTIRALAAEADISESNIKTWLRGGEPKKLEEVRSAAHVLGVSFEQIVFGEDSMSLERIASQFWEDLYSGIIRVKVEKLKPRK